MTIWNPEVKNGHGPLYLAIADALEADIQKGVLNPGNRLPTHRDLAERLRVTVGTITRAYQEGYRRGLLRGEVGRGTFVSGKLPDPIPLHVQSDRPAHLVELACNYPIYAQDPPLAETLSRLAAKADLQELLKYQPSEGMHRHRVAGAGFMKKYGLDVPPSQVLVTAGSQHASQVVLGALTKPGDVVLAEALTFPNMKSLAAMMSLRLEPVDLDEHGLVPRSFEDACRKHGPKALYCIPTLHNPTNATMPENRRLEVADIARHYNVAIVEDDNYRLLEPDAPPPLSSYAPEIGFFIAGASKAITAGLRVAFVSGPAKSFNRLMHSIATTMIMVPPLNAEIVATWLEDGTAEKTVADKRKEARIRNRAAQRILSSFTCHSRPHSFHLWLELPEPWRGNQLAEAAYRRGVAVTPADAFVVGHAPVPNAVRISISAARDCAALEKALRVLAELLAEPPVGACFV